MPIAVACPCGKQLRAKDSHAGRTARCPQCREPVRIPLPSRDIAIRREVVSPSLAVEDPLGGVGLDHEQDIPANPGRSRRPRHATELLHVHMGRDGLHYYRERRASGAPADSGRDVELLPPRPLAGVSPDEVLEEINLKRGATSLAQLHVAGGISLAFLGAVLVGNAMIALAWSCFAASIAAFVSVPWARWRDRRAITNLIYSHPDGGLGENMQEGVRKLFETFAGTLATWCIDTQHFHGDWKRNGGAGTSVGRRRIRAGLAVPPRIRTNAKVGYLEVDHRRYYFFPDRILAYLPRGVESVSYDELSVSVATTRFVESESVPADAQVVGQTWLYVNKDGGPDRRFKNNRQYPVALYGELALEAGSTLNFKVQTSRAATADAARVVLELMGRASAELKSRPGPVAPPLPPAIAGFEDDPSPADRVLAGYDRLPDWAKAAVLGCAVAVPAVALIAAVFSR